MIGRNVDMINVREIGAKGDGIHDDGAIIQMALLSEEEEVYIPDGTYLVNKMLEIGSNKRIIADRDAIIYCGDKVLKEPTDFLMTNSDHEKGNVNIHIEGGLWDGNNLNNARVSDHLDTSTYTGTMIRFFNVKGLTMKNMILKDPEAYYTCFCMVEDFYIENIEFRADLLRPNQDGLHFAGYCKNGVVKDVFSKTEGVPNDDMLALNADDEMYRLTNLGLKRGYIKNITFSNVHALSCHSLIRMLSIEAEISNIKVTNSSAGCKHYAINMDGARYCRTPLFMEEDMPEGIGNIKDISIDYMMVWRANRISIPLLDFESNVSNFSIKNFTRVRKNESSNTSPTLIVQNVKKHIFEIDEEKITVKMGETYRNQRNSYRKLLVDNQE